MSPSSPSFPYKFSPVISLSSRHPRLLSPCLYLSPFLCHPSLNFHSRLSRLRRIIPATPPSSVPFLPFRFLSLLPFSCPLSTHLLLLLLLLLFLAQRGERVFHQPTPVSGTFQLACIPASGCVADKMEQIPPGLLLSLFSSYHTRAHAHKTGTGTTQACVNHLFFFFARAQPREATL